MKINFKIDLSMEKRMRK